MASGDPLHECTIGGSKLSPAGSGRALVRRGVPEAVKGAAARLVQLLVFEALPLAEILFGKIGDCWRVGSGDRLRPGEPGADDRPRRLVGAAQIARDPCRIARQLAREAGKYRPVGAVCTVTMSFWP